MKDFILFDWLYGYLGEGLLEELGLVIINDVGLF